MYDYMHIFIYVYMNVHIYLDLCVMQPRVRVLQYWFF